MSCTPGSDCCTDADCRDAPWTTAEAAELERAAIAAENDRRRLEHPVRLDAELWAPPFIHVPPPSPAEQERLAWRRANRPFRRAFVGGELRRRALLKVGEFIAKSKEAQS